MLFQLLGYSPPEESEKSYEYSIGKCTYEQVQVDSLKCIHEVVQVMNHCTIVTFLKLKSSYFIHLSKIHQLPLIFRVKCKPLSRSKNIY